MSSGDHQEVDVPEDGVKLHVELDFEFIEFCETQEVNIDAAFYHAFERLRAFVSFPEVRVITDAGDITDDLIHGRIVRGQRPYTADVAVDKTTYAILQAVGERLKLSPEGTIHRATEVMGCMVTSKYGLAGPKGLILNQFGGQAHIHDSGISEDDFPPQALEGPALN